MALTTTAISAARFKLAYNRPYIANAVWALVPVEKPGLGTLAVDKYWRLYYDPEVEKMWTVDNLVAVLYHEVNHLLREHNERGETKSEHFDWNLAADAEINDDLEDEKCWDMPKGYMTPEAIQQKRNLMAEVYYEAIQKMKKDQGKGSGQLTKGNGKDGEGSPTGPAMPGNGKCGSAAGGQSQDYEDGPPDANTPGLKPGEQDVMKKQVAQEIQEASKSRGNVPAHLDRWAKDRLKEKVDWRKTLATHMRNCVAHVAGASDYTFKKMSRRNSGDIILPATHSPVANVAVVLDTSGSMSQGMVTQAVTEVGGILRSQGANLGVSVLAVDAQVHKVQKVFKKEQIQLRGGGGTDMRIGIDGAMQLKPRPDIIVVITDGETPWPANPPGPKVIICLIPRYGIAQTPSWAKTVICQDEEE